MLGSERNFILTDCTAKQSLMQPTQQQQPLKKKMVHFAPFRLSFLPVFCFGGTSCKQLHWRSLESLVLFIPNKLPCKCRSFFSSQDYCSQFFYITANKSYSPICSQSCCMEQDIFSVLVASDWNQELYPLISFPWKNVMSPVPQGKRYSFAW